METPFRIEINFGTVVVKSHDKPGQKTVAQYAIDLLAVHAAEETIIDYIQRNIFNRIFCQMDRSIFQNPCIA